MAEETHTYSLAADFPGGAINAGNLRAEIQASTIVTALERIDVAGDVVDVIFKDNLSTGDKTTLDNDATGPAGGLIAAHDNADPAPLNQVELTAKHTDPEGLPYARPKASGVNFILCDRDVRITTGQFAQADAIEDLRYNPTDHSRADWDEAILVGVFKEDGNGNHGALTACADQADAAANGICTVIDYIAKDQNANPKTEIRYEIRGGALWVDEAQVPVTAFEHQIYAVAAPNIPSASGGRMTLFDGYLAATDGRIIEALSSDAFRLDPAGPGGIAGATVRIAIYYPAASAVDHILRLNTYREPGTF